PVSPEKSIDSPPKGEAPVPFRSVPSDPGRRTDSPACSAPGCCLLIDANIPPRPYPGGVSSRGSCVPELREHARAQELQLVRLVDVTEAEQDVLDARVAELTEARHELIGGRGATTAIATHANVRQGRPLDVLERPADRLAVPAQDRELVHDRLR